METGLILLAVGFLVLVYLIFKFIKKVIYASLLVVLLIIMIFGATVGLVYLDLQNLASQTDYEVQFVLAEGDNLILGASIPVKEQNVDFEAVEGIPRAEISEIDVDEITKDDNVFVVTIDREFLEEIMVEEYSFDGIELSPELSEYNMTLTKEEILSLMDEGSTPGEMVDILFEKNNVNPLVVAIGKPLLVAQIESYLEERNMGFRTAVFLIALTGSLEKEANYLALIQGYKEEGNIEIYPDRLTFSFVRMLPAGTIAGFLGEFS